MRRFDDIAARNARSHCPMHCAAVSYKAAVRFRPRSRRQNGLPTQEEIPVSVQLSLTVNGKAVKPTSTSARCSSNICATNWP
jgi:hypothetical protein